MLPLFLSNRQAGTAYEAAWVSLLPDSRRSAYPIMAAATDATNMPIFA